MSKINAARLWGAALPALASFLVVAGGGCELLLGGGGAADAAMPADAATPIDASIPDAGADLPDGGCEVTLTCPVPTAGLVAHYKFDGDGNDSVGGATLAAVGVTWGLDRFGTDSKSAKLTDTSPTAGASLSGPNAALPLGNSPRTLAIWVNADQNLYWEQTSYRSIVGYGTTFQGQRFGISTNWDSASSAELPFFTGQSADVPGSIDIQFGWHFVAVTYDGTTVSLYVDGKLDNALGPRLNTVGDELVVGRRPSVDEYEHFSGLVDDLRIYDRALDASEIAALFHENGFH